MSRLLRTRAAHGATVTALTGLVAARAHHLAHPRQGAGSALRPVGPKLTPGDRRTRRVAVARWIHAPDEYYQ